jgi:hypothetical protein
MLERGGGKIVNVGALAAQKGAANMGADLQDSQPGSCQPT